MAPSATSPEQPPEYIIVHAGKGTIKRQILTGAQKKPTFESIPQVDFSLMDSPSLQDRQSVAQQVGAAFRDSGFLYAANHGISQELQAELTQVIKEFFDLPLEEKMKVRIFSPSSPSLENISSQQLQIHVNKSDTIKGYEALLETKLDASTRGDLKEAFAVGDSPYDSEQNPPSSPTWSGWTSYPKNANQWPASPPHFRKILYAYNAAILAFSRKLMRMIALALHLDEDYFDHMADFPMAGLRALHYPAQERADDVGIGAHADYSWFTLVNQLSDTPALEVLNGNGEWVSAPPIANTLVCNVGDFLEMATGGKFVSTVHRVVNKTGRERYSIPYFFSPSADVMIETLPGCEAGAEGGKMTPIRAGDWHLERLLRARYKHPSSVAARARGAI
jgi:isopenicillin N synthase-like dioxygenase